MKTRMTVIATIAASALLTAALLANDPVRELKLQQAIDLIESKGDVAHAVPLLEDAAKSTDHALAARALLYLGQAQERTDKAVARKTYRRILDQFADQSETAAAAGARLSALGSKPAAELIDRVVLANDLDLAGGEITPDGSSILFADGATGGPAIRNLAAGQVTALTNGSASNSAFPRLSPDGQRVAYTKPTPEKVCVAFVVCNGMEIRVVDNRPGSQPRIVWPPAAGRGDFAGQVVVWGWSADGKSLLAELARPDATWEFHWVSADTGVVGPALASSDWRRSTPVNPATHRVSLSPDRRYLAYSAAVTNPRSPGPGLTSDVDEAIYVLATDGSSRTELTHTAGINRQPIWTADGSHVLFLSNASGSVGLWAAGVREGKPTGTPFLVKPDIGLMTPLAMTRAGTLYYAGSAGNGGPPRVAFADLQSGPQGASASGTVTTPLFGVGPKWSPDGRSIAVQRPGSDKRSTLVVRSLTSGQEVSLTPPPDTGLNLWSYTWLHDGTGLLVEMSRAASNVDPNSGALLAAEHAIYRADLKSGQIQEVRTVERWRDPGTFSMVLSPDDRILYFGGVPGGHGHNNVEAIDVATGQRHTVFEAPARQNVLGKALSADGKSLVLEIVVFGGQPGSPAPGVGKLVRIGVDGNGYRELATGFRLVSQSVFCGGDSQLVWFATSDPTSSTGSSPRLRLMRVSADGGTPSFTGLELDGNKMDVNPNGTHVAFTPSVPAHGLHALDNVLAVLKVQQ